MKALHFCIDIDNVLGQTDSVIREVIREVTQGRVSLQYTDIREFNYHECRDSLGNSISKDEWKTVHDKFSEAQHLRKVEFLPDAVEALHEIACFGQIHIATTRLPSARRSTVEWLEAAGVPSHTLHFLNHGEKHSSLRCFDYAVEDDYQQALAFAAVPGTQAILVRHPWNISKPPAPHLAWVDKWNEIVNLIKLRT